MTVSELIMWLQEEDQNAIVVTRGYEGGYCDINSVAKYRYIVLNVNDEWYYGPHDGIDALDEKEYLGKTQVKALLLGD
jgi:hypothetical protein